MRSTQVSSWCGSDLYDPEGEDVDRVVAVGTVLKMLLVLLTTSKARKRRETNKVAVVVVVVDIVVREEPASK